MAESKLSKLKMDDEAEQGSSEETLEGASNVSTKPFSHIASCQLLVEKTVGWNNKGEITGIVLLPDGQVVIRQSREQQLKILDKDMETKLTMTYAPSSICSMEIALFDRKRVAVAIRTQEEEEEATFINIMSVSPNVQLGPEIKRKNRCEKITCFNNKIYCYSPDLKISLLIECPGIEILTQTGDLLKTIQLFDLVSCFCPSKDGNIIYFGSRQVENSTATFFKCVTYDNTEVFQYPTSLQPTYAVSDTQGGIIILNSSGDIVLLNPDGSTKGVLLDQNNIGLSSFTSMSFSDEINTLLLAGVCYPKPPKMLLYQLQ